MRQAFIAMRIRLLAGLAAVALAACGGGAPTSENPNTTPPTQPAYNGPPPATADVQAFRINLWDNIKASNRCGGCHVAGQQAPMFARQDDINLAYEAANGIVNLSDPSSSRMVQKVGGGHNCWLASPDACADLLTTWITNWAGDAAGGGGTQIQLVAPADKAVGDSRVFPDSSSAYDGIYNLVTGASLSPVQPQLLALPFARCRHAANSLFREYAEQGRGVRGCARQDQSRRCPWRLAGRCQIAAGRAPAR